MKIKLAGIEYPMVDPDDVTTDDAEAIESYTGQRYSLAYNPMAVNSDIKIMKVGTWLAVKYAGIGTPPPALAVFSFRLGDFDYVPENDAERLQMENARRAQRGEKPLEALEAAADPTPPPAEATPPATGLSPDGGSTP